MGVGVGVGVGVRVGVAEGVGEGEGVVVDGFGEGVAVAAACVLVVGGVTGDAQEAKITPMGRTTRGRSRRIPTILGGVRGGIGRAQEAPIPSVLIHGQLSWFISIRNQCGQNPIDVPVTG